MISALLVALPFWAGSPHNGGPPFLEIVNPDAGQRATLAISNADPGKRARIGWSLAGPGPSSFSSPWGNLDLAFSSPFTLTPPLMTDSQGKASFTRSLPLTAVGTTIWAQGVVFDRTGAELTNPVVQLIQ